MGYVKDEDLRAAAVLPEVDPELGDADGDIAMEDGWDAI
jgi:hypothetical protein